MTNIEKLEDKIDDSKSTIQYRKRFIEVLVDPSKWEYSGICNDLEAPVGKCICGHPIRFEYIIQYKGKKEIVGSECINHFQSINPTLYNNLIKADEEMKEKIKQLKKKAKEVEQNKEIEILKSQYEISYKQFTDKYDSYIKQGKKVPYELWYARNSNIRIRKEPKEYNRKTDYIRFYKDNLKWIERIMEEASHEQD